MSDEDYQPEPEDLLPAAEMRARARQQKAQQRQRGRGTVRGKRLGRPRSRRGSGRINDWTSREFRNIGTDLAPCSGRGCGMQKLVDLLDGQADADVSPAVSAQ